MCLCIGSLREGAVTEGDWGRARKVRLTDHKKARKFQSAAGSFHRKRSPFLSEEGFLAQPVYG